MELAKNGKNQLGRAQDEWGNPRHGGRETVYDGDNKKSTEKMDWSHRERRHHAEKNHQGKNRGMKYLRETKNDDTGLDDDRGWIGRSQETGTQLRRVASLDI